MAATFASDKYDRKTRADFKTTQLMLWREEQRAIGEVMRVRGGDSGRIGFNAFEQRYCPQLADQFKRFSDELESIFGSTSGAETASKRLWKLHGTLAQLLMELDIDRAVVKFDDAKVVKPEWVYRAPTLHELLLEENDAPVQ